MYVGGHLRSGFTSLRQEDLREVVEGHGLQPTIDIPLASLRGFLCTLYST